MPLVVSQDVEEYADLFDKLIKMVLINLRIFKTTEKKKIIKKEIKTKTYK